MDAKKQTEFFIEKMKDTNVNLKRKYFISTFGCQMNAHDSEKISGMMKQMGYLEAADEKTANVVIYNTCCVRENAENRVYGNLGFLKNIKAASSDYKIILCGCMMQQDAIVKNIRQKYKQVDIIFGTYNMHRLPELLLSSYETNDLIIDIWQEHGETVEDLPTERTLPFKASVNIMYGCNNFCTYCIVPYVRGRERSRTSKEIISQVENLAKSGVKEVMLLGQNVNSYGYGLEEGIDFSGLLEVISKIDGIERIRFLTSHPKDLSLRLIETIRDNEKICKHLHLPFQAGSNEVLKSMNRKYSKEHYLSLIAMIKREIPSISITTDIIVGFPGETDEDFMHTIDVANKVRFQMAFTFYYSKRIGTEAANMENQVSESDAKFRFDNLLEILNPIAYDINKSFVGEIFGILAETYDDKTKILSGRADNNTLVHFSGEKELIGQIVNVKITEGKPFYAIGEICN